MNLRAGLSSLCTASTVSAATTTIMMCRVHYLEWMYFEIMTIHNHIHSNCIAIRDAITHEQLWVDFLNANN